MDRDNYEYICAMPELAKEMGIDEATLTRVCWEFKKSHISHLKMQKEMEENKLKSDLSEFDVDKVDDTEK